MNVKDMIRMEKRCGGTDGIVGHVPGWGGGDSDGYTAGDG